MNYQTEKQTELWKLKIFLASTSTFVKFKQTEWKNLYKILQSNLDIFDKENIFSKQMLKSKFVNFRKDNRGKRKKIKDSKIEKMKWEKKKLDLGKKLFNKLKKDYLLKNNLIFNKNEISFRRNKSSDIFAIKKNTTKDILMSDPISYTNNFRNYLNKENFYFQKSKKFFNNLNYKILRDKKFFIYSRSFSNSKKTNIEKENVISPSFKKIYYYLYIKDYIKNKTKENNSIFFKKIIKRKKQNLHIWEKITKNEMKILDGEIYRIFKQKDKHFNLLKLKSKLKLISNNSRISMFKIRSSTKLVLKEFLPTRRKSKIFMQKKKFKKSKFKNLIPKNYLLNKYDSTKKNYVIKNSYSKTKIALKKPKKSITKNYFSNRNNYLNKNNNSNKNFINLNCSFTKSKKSCSSIKKKDIKEFFFISRRKSVMKSYLDSSRSLTQSINSFKQKKINNNLNEDINQRYGKISKTKSRTSTYLNSSMLPKIGINFLDSSYNCL